MQDIDLLELEISEEIKNSSGNLRNYLYNYIKNSELKKLKMVSEINMLEKRINIVTEEIIELFSELKSLELYLKQKATQIKAKLLKDEQNEIDDLSIIKLYQEGVNEDSKHNP